VLTNKQTDAAKNIHLALLCCAMPVDKNHAIVTRSNALCSCLTLVIWLGN